MPTGKLRMRARTVSQTHQAPVTEPTTSETLTRSSPSRNSTWASGARTSATVGTDEPPPPVPRTADAAFAPAPGTPRRRLHERRQHLLVHHRGPCRDRHADRV